MPDDPNWSLQELREVIAKQQDLLNFVLQVLSQGSAEFLGERFTSTVDWNKARAVAAVSMGAAQSMNTVLKLSNEEGIGARDLYPIARSVVEGFVNAAFFVTQPVEVSERALRHKEYAAWKHWNRVIGSGDFMIKVGSSENLKPFLEKEFPEFVGKGQGSWTNLDVPTRIGRVGEAVQVVGGALIGAYAGIYAISSEIIHGSVYGAAYFFSAHAGNPKTIDGFRRGVLQQRIDILSAVTHAASGFLSAYGNTQKFGALVLAEHELFKRLYRAATGDDW